MNGPAPDPRCALVLLTHDRRAEICAAVERALALPERPELVVVDNGSRDGTARALAARWPALHVVRSDRNLGAAGRNLGIRATRRPFVAFGDDDTAWQPGALRLAADALEADPRLAVVTARVVVGDAQRDDPACAAMARSPVAGRAAHGVVPVVGFLAGACMVRRSAFLAQGGYEPRLFLGGEEALLAIDLLVAGWHLAYLPGARVRHWPSPARDADRRRRDLRRNAMRVAWLRRSLPHALRTTLACLREARREGGALADALALARSVPWLARARRAMPAGVERRLRAVEHAMAAADAGGRGVSRRSEPPGPGARAPAPAGTSEGQPSAPYRYALPACPGSSGSRTKSSSVPNESRSA
ncbi:MAG TPA: glycosyltransferase, partial [Myxococcota bacterium]